MNKWTEYILYGGDIPEFDLPTVNMPDLDSEERGRGRTVRWDHEGGEYVVVE